MSAAAAAAAMHSVLVASRRRHGHHKSNGTKEKTEKIIDLGSYAVVRKVVKNEAGDTLESVLEKNAHIGIDG